MRSSTGVICFLLALPALAVLGHDVYMAFFAKQPPGGSHPFQLSDLGWLWVTYEPATYKWALGQVSAATWARMIDPVLRQTALVVALAPAVLGYAVLAVMKFLGPVVFGAGKGGDADDLSGSGKKRVSRKDKTKAKAKYKWK